MRDRLSEIEARVQQLEDIVRDLRGFVEPRIERISPAPSAVATTASRRADSVVWLTLAGRTLMALGGAFLLRALTESGRLPASAGVFIGLGYALAWLGAAEVGATEERRLSGAFHGLTAVLIGVPLLLEAATRFRFLSAGAGAASIAGLAVLTLAVAWHRRLQSLAAVVTIGAILAALILAVRTGRPVPVTAAVLAIGAGATILAELRSWRWAQWPPALAANVLLFVLAGRATAAPPLEDPRTVLAIQLIFICTYTAMAVWRTGWRRDPIHPFDLVQTPLAMAIGFGGIWAIWHGHSPAADGVLAIALAVLAAGAYAAALLVFVPRDHARSTTVAYLTFGLLLALAAASLLLAGEKLAATCAALSVVLAFGARRLDQPILALHGAIVALIAGLSSSLLDGAAVVWITMPPWPVVSWLAMAVLLASVAGIAIGRRGGSPGHPVAVTAIVPAFVLGSAVVFVAGAWLVRAFASLSGDISRESVSSIRTMALAVLALGVAATGRWWARATARWLVYAVLLAGGLVLLIDDMAHATAARLFLDFAAYGAALILAPRIVAPK